MALMMVASLILVVAPAFSSIFNLNLTEENFSIMNLFWFVLDAVIFAFLSIGYIRICMNIFDGKSASLKMLFSGSDLFGSYVYK